MSVILVVTVDRFGAVPHPLMRALIYSGMSPLGCAASLPCGICGNCGILAGNTPPITLPMPLTMRCKTFGTYFLSNIGWLPGCGVRITSFAGGVGLPFIVLIP